MRTVWREVRGGVEAGEGPLAAVLAPGVRGDPAELAGLGAALLAGWAAEGRAARLRIVRTPEGPERTLAAISARIAGDLPAEPVRWIGASFGGLLGRAMPPGRVRELVCIGAMPGPGRSARQAGRIARLLRWLPEPAYRALYAGARRGAGAELAIPPRRVMAARLGAIAAWGLPGRVGIPARCVWGEDDPFVDWTEGAVRAAGMEPVIVRGGHFPHLEDPERLALALPGDSGGRTG